MALFKLNICKFNNCDLIFNNLYNLIVHIETSHINYDPKMMTQFETQTPTCLPLSYVLKFSANSVEDEKPFNEGIVNQNSILATPVYVETQVDDTVVVKKEDYSFENEEKDETEEKSMWINTMNNSNKIIKNNKNKKTYKCHCGKSFNSGPTYRKHSAQCNESNAFSNLKVREISQQAFHSPSTTIEEINSESSDNNGIDNVTIQPSQNGTVKRLFSTTDTWKTLPMPNKSTCENNHAKAIETAVYN